MHSPLVLATATAAALALVGSMPRVDAYAKYIKALPNGGDIPDAPACGHPDAAGMEGVNDFGKAFKKAGNAWTKALCMADSDGDGFTNGQEMGDPCCTWTPTSTAGLITDGISHPSDKTKTPTNAKLTAGCSASGTTGTTGTTGTATTTTTKAPTAGTSGASNTTTGGVSDVLAPVSATAAPKVAGGAMPADDDEDDSSESAVATTASSASVASASRVAVALCVSVVLAAAAF